MAECEWAILCDYAFLDAAKKHCLIGVFDRINVHSVPATHQRAAFVLKLSGKDSEQVHVKIEIVRPTGAVLAKMEADVILAEGGGAALQLELVGLPLPDYGFYPINLYLADELAKKIGFVVERPRVKAPS